MPRCDIQYKTLLLFRLMARAHHTLASCCSISPRLSIGSAAVLAPCSAPSQGRGQGSAEAAQPGWNSPGSSLVAAAHLTALKGHPVLHISQPQVLFSSLTSPKLLLPAALQASWKGPGRTPRHPNPQACTSPCVLEAGGHSKPQNSCRQLLRHI